MSQKRYQIIVELKPLEVAFGQMTDEKRGLYATHLEKFSLEAIRSAIDKVIGTWSDTWMPPPGAIAKECVENGAGTGIASPVDNYPWFVISRKQREASHTYVMNFVTTSDIIRSAELDQIYDDVYHYVKAVADVQAALIYPQVNGNFGIEWRLIEPQINRPENIEQWRWGFIENCKRQAATGYIDVAIPTSKWDEWLVLKERRTAPRAIKGEEQDISRITNPLIPAIDKPKEEVRVIPPDPYDDIPDFDIPPVEAYSDYF